MRTRIITFCILIGIALLAPLWLFLVCAALYALTVRGYELIVLGMFIDAQFGVASTSFPYLYTVSTGAIILVLELAKPHLTFYES
jgi:hypothetical protein